MKKECRSLGPWLRLTRDGVEARVAGRWELLSGVQSWAILSALRGPDERKFGEFEELKLWTTCRLRGLFFRWINDLDLGYYAAQPGPPERAFWLQGSATPPWPTREDVGEAFRQMKLAGQHFRQHWRMARKYLTDVFGWTAGLPSSVEEAARPLGRRGRIQKKKKKGD